MTLSEKVAYLKGVAEGLKFDPEQSAEGKLISIMMDILEHMALNAEENDDSIQALADQLDDVSDSLGMLEDYVYSDDIDFGAEDAEEVLDEDGFIEMECPGCGDTLVVDKDILDSGRVVCPGCGQTFEIELSYEDEDDEGSSPD